MRTRAIFLPIQPQLLRDFGVSITRRSLIRGPRRLPHLCLPRWRRMEGGIAEIELARRPAVQNILYPVLYCVFTAAC